MEPENKALVLDLVEWIARQPRPYGEVMEAWQTSCPRLPVWEDTLDLGLVACERQGSAGVIVRLTPAGRTFLESERPTAPPTR